MNLAWIQEYKIVCTCWLFRLFPLILGYAAFGWWFGSSLAVGVFQFGGENGVVLQLEMTEHALWRPSDREDRQREPPGHMTGEVNVHAGKEKERRNNLFDRSSRSPSLSSLILSLSQTHTLPHSLLLCRLLLLNGGHEKKAGMMLPGGTRETTC